jgi:Family of unknown function (DUF5681)
MSSKNPRNQAGSRRGGADAPYEVGYGKPPTGPRFKPGQSGNPKGRPKGSGKPKPDEVFVERMKAIVVAEAYRTISIRDGGEVLEIPVIQAAVRSVALNAAKGKQRSQRMLFDLTGGIETERRREREKLFEAVVDYKLYWESEIANARKLGVPKPSPLPHPDDLLVNPLDGSVVSRGPWTKEEKVHWDQITNLRTDILADLEEAEKDLRQAPDDAEVLNRRIVMRSVIERIDKLLSSERVIVAPVRSCGHSG